MTQRLEIEEVGLSLVVMRKPAREVWKIAFFSVIDSTNNVHEVEISIPV